MDKILYDIKLGNQIDQISDYVNNFNSPLDLHNFYNLNKDKFNPKPKMKWIPYSQIKNLTEIAKGGFGIIYKATLGTLDGPVALKKYFNSQNMSKCFLNEVIVIFI